MQNWLIGATYSTGDRGQATFSPWANSLGPFIPRIFPVLSLLRSMRNYEATSRTFRVYLVCLPACWWHYKPVLATSFRIKAAVRSANRANRERLRSVNDCVERCACQSAHPIYKRWRIMYVYMRACICLCVHVYVCAYICTCVYVCKHRRATTRAYTRAPRAMVTRWIPRRPTASVPL